MRDLSPRTAGRTVACLAHIRRKFFDLHAASGSPVAEQALHRIAQLYAIEQQAHDMTPAQRLALRQQRAVPALADLHAWLLATQRTAAAGSGTAKAIEHALKRWPALQRYAGSGHLPIDNNPVEKLDAALSADPSFAAAMNQLSPNITNRVSSVGGRNTPLNYTWHHDK